MWDLLYSVMLEIKLLSHELVKGSIKIEICHTPENSNYCTHVASKII